MTLYNLVMEIPAPPDWWKKYKPLRWGAGVTVIVVAAGFLPDSSAPELPAAHPEATAYTAVAADPLPMTAGWRSYDRIEAVGAALTAAGFTPERRTNHKPSDPRWPPCALDTLTVAAYTHLGVSGELALEFFNDRLFAIHFEPGDANAYARALRAAEPSLQRDRLGNAELIQGARRVASNVDYARSEVGRAAGARPYIVWQDTRLVQQRDDWETRFSVMSLTAN